MAVKDNLNIYTTISYSDWNDRTATALSGAEQTEVRGTITKFIELFKAEHS